jgi:hypothetical protein
MPADEKKDPPIDKPVPSVHPMRGPMRMVVRQLSRIVGDLDPAGQTLVEQTMALLSSAEFRPGPGGGARRCPVCGRPVNG